MNSRTKGKRGELELVKALRALGLDAERTVQHEGRGSAGDIRIFGCCIHTENKRRRRLTVQAFMDQAERDMVPHHVPLVVMRQDGGKHLAMFRLADLWSLMTELERARRHKADGFRTSAEAKPCLAS